MPDTIKISELDEALAIADAAEFPYTQENGGELTTFKAPLTQIAAKVVEDMSYAGINLPVGAGVKSVENTLNYLLGAVGGNPNENIATEYDPTETYAKGDYVIYENVLYICTDSDGTTGTFDPTAWSQTELAEHTAENAANVGDLSTLTTTDKSSLVGAVNEVDAGLGNTYTKSETDTKIDNNFKRVATVWGTSVTLPVDRNHFIVLADNRMFVVWFAGTNEIQIRSVGANTTASGTNSVTFDNTTFIRNGLRLTVTTSSNDAITIIG